MFLLEVDVMQQILLDTYTIVLPIVLSYIVWLLKQQNKKRDANSKGTMLLIRIQIIEYHDKYCRLGYIPSYVLDNVMELFEAYKDLGGNGMVKQLIEEIKELDIRKERFYVE